MDGVIELHDSESGASAKVATDFGFNCFSLDLPADEQLVSILDAEAGFPGPESRPSGHGIPLLFPYPNRIREGRYSWEGKDYHLPPELVSYNKQNAIHGFCLDRPWRVIDQSSTSVTGEFQLSVDAPDRRSLWPADFVIRCTYRLRTNGLKLEVEIVNPDDRALPWGFGTHPYFRLPLLKSSKPTDCLIEAPLASEWELIESLPSGKMLELVPSEELCEGAYFGTFGLDAVFRLQDGKRSSVIMDEAAGWQVRQSFSDAFREFVIFTPPNRDAICLEPYTCTTDAINLTDSHSGLTVLPPGETVSLWVDLELLPVIA